MIVEQVKYGEVKKLNKKQSCINGANCVDVVSIQLGVKLNWQLYDKQKFNGWQRPD